MLSLKHQLILNFLILGIWGATSTGNGATTYQSIGTVSTGQIVFDSQFATLDWTIDSTDVTFTLRVTQKYWFAVGFKSGMVNVDMFVAQVNANNNVEILDLWSTGERLPTTDTVQDYTITASDITGTGFSATFKRKLDTSETTQDSKLVVNTQYTWGWAYKTGEKIMTNQHNHAGNVQMTFGKEGLPGSGTPTTPTSDTSDTVSDGNGATTYQSKGTLTSGEAIFDSKFATLGWTISNDIVTFTLSVTKKYWFAIGFGNKMNNVDMFVAQINSNNVVEVLDLWSTGESLPGTDTSTQDTLVTAQSILGDGFSVTFTRKLDTGDTSDTKLTVGSDYSWGWAYKTNEQVMASQHDKAGQIQVTFGKAGVATQRGEDDDEKTSVQIIFPFIASALLFLM